MGGIAKNPVQPAVVIRQKKARSASDPDIPLNACRTPPIHENQKTRRWWKKAQEREDCVYAASALASFLGAFSFLAAAAFFGAAAVFLAAGEALALLTRPAAVFLRGFSAAGASFLAAAAFLGAAALVSFLGAAAFLAAGFFSVVVVVSFLAAAAFLGAAAAFLGAAVFFSVVVASFLGAASFLAALAVSSFFFLESLVPPEGPEGKRQLVVAQEVGYVVRIAYPWAAQRWPCQHRPSGPC